MALTTQELNVTRGLRSLGANPTLIAKLLNRDPRVILDAIRRHTFGGPPTSPPTRPVTKELQEKAAEVVRFAKDLDLSHTLDKLLSTIRASSPADVNLLLKLLVTELEKYRDEDPSQPTTTLRRR